MAMRSKERRVRPSKKKKEKKKFTREITMHACMHATTDEGQMAM
jgi:hypothetical protein